jgi:hypothetical protein
VIIVSEIFNQIGAVLGTCDESYVFDILTSAIELLANKPTKTNICWDSLLIYCDIPIVQGYYVCLPSAIEKPIKVNISKQPAFSRNQFFEFSINGPGTLDPEAGWSWQDRGWKPLQKPWPSGGQQFLIMSDNANDNNTQVLLNTINQDQSMTWVTAVIGTAGPKIYGLYEVSKPVTQGNLSLYASPFILQSALVATWAAEVLYPQFEWIKLSQSGVSCKILARRRTYKITALTDVIPLANRQAIITACIAIKAYRTLNWDDGAVAEQNALRFLDEDQGARNIFQRVSVAAETTPTLNLSINNRESIIVADIYDFACDVFGPIGQYKIFDRMTEAIELLMNLSQWDGAIGYVDITTFDSFYVTLPQYVDQVIAINVNKSTGSFRNQWFEFHMNGLGQDNDNADAVGSNRPCEGWEEVGEMPCAFPLWSPSYLVASPLSIVDNGTPIRAYGIDQNDLPIYDATDKNLGAVITCEQGSFDISRQQLPFKRIDRITIGEPQGFIDLYATDGTQYLQSLGTFWPNISEPKFRVIKIGQKAVTVRLRYRKRWTKITSLTDPLHMRSRTAIMNALRAIQTGIQDPNGANVLLMAAKDALNKEWRSTHPHEQLGIQIDPSIWGSSFVQMPAVVLFTLSPIKSLFTIGGPLHVSWLVAAIIIYTLQRKFGLRRFPDVAIERLKRILPLRADGDPALLVVTNFFRSLRSLGSQLHIKPRAIDLRTIAQAVTALFAAGNLAAKAATTFRMIIGDGMFVPGNDIAAITSKSPKNDLSLIGLSGDSDQTTEPLTGDICGDVHSRPDSILVGVTHLSIL